jgi:3-oxoacyl-[acyl-carrier protein] reductase
MPRVLVTAATSSIGRVIAETLAGHGFALTLHFHTSHDLAGKLADNLHAELLRADLSEPDGASGFIEQLRQRSKFDVIVNNAGVSEEEDDTDLAAWERVLRINAVVPALILANAEHLLNDNAVVINISSTCGHERFGGKDLAPYSASKAALNSITRTFAKKLAPRVRVNAIAPGNVDSRWNEGYSERARAELAAEQLTGRLVTAQQVADLTVHIVANTALDGEIIYLDGGSTLPG